MFTYLVKFKRNEPDKYLIPLALYWRYPTELYLAFIKSESSATDLMISGTDASYIGLTSVYLDIQCQANSEITVGEEFGSINSAVLTSSQSLVTFADGTSRSYAYLGRPCYTPTGVSPYCTVLGLRFFREQNSHLFFVTTQDRYYEDSTPSYQVGMLGTTDQASLITYKNGNATVPGKFIAVHNTLTSFFDQGQYYFDHPTYLKFYERYIYDFPSRTLKGEADPGTVANQATLTQVSANCAQNTYSVSSTASSSD